MALEKFKKFLGESDNETDVSPEEEYYTTTKEEYHVANGVAGSKMILLEPRAYSESQQIADYLKGCVKEWVNLIQIYTK